MDVSFHEMNFHQQFNGCISEEGYSEHFVEVEQLSRRPSLNRYTETCVFYCCIHTSRVMLYFSHVIHDDINLRVDLYVEMISFSVDLDEKRQLKIDTILRTFIKIVMLNLAWKVL